VALQARPELAGRLAQLPRDRATVTGCGLPDRGRNLSEPPLTLTRPARLREPSSRARPRRRSQPTARGTAPVMSRPAQATRRWWRGSRIHPGEADLVDQLDHRPLGIGVVAGEGASGRRRPRRPPGPRPQARSPLSIRPRLPAPSARGRGSDRRRPGRPAVTMDAPCEEGRLGKAGTAPASSAPSASLRDGARSALTRPVVLRTRPYEDMPAPGHPRKHRDQAPTLPVIRDRQGRTPTDPDGQNAQPRAARASA
jgi:hypothetical protein